jgi:hypothetical protein
MQDHTMHTNRRTRQGSPCAQSWDEDWVGVVEKAERVRGRRICGARTLAGTPCTLEPNHANGRCRFHGGFDLTGAPAGNRNALVHGLYARRLQVCGPHCPMWDGCPCAEDAVAKLPKPERPVCPYEQSEYNAVVTDWLRQWSGTDPAFVHLVHNAATLQVMVTRAAAALREAGFTTDVTVESKDYSMTSTKPHAALTAFLRVSSELRRAVGLLEKRLTTDGQYGRGFMKRTPIDDTDYDARRMIDTDLHPDTQLAVADPEAVESPARDHLEVVAKAERAKEEEVKAYADAAIRHAKAGDNDAMWAACRAVRDLCPEAEEDLKKAVLEACYARDG